MLVFFALGFILVLPFSVVSFGFCEPLPNQINLPLWCSDAFRGLLLKDVQDIDSILKTHRTDSSPRISVVRSDNFEHAGTAKAFERFSSGPAFLGSEHSMSMSILTARGKERKSRSEVPIHRMGFSAPFICIPIYVYSYTSSSLARSRCDSGTRGNRTAPVYGSSTYVGALQQGPMGNR